MIEKWEIEGYRRVYVTENDYSNYTWVKIASREFEEYPTEMQKEQFCNEFNIDKIKVQKIELRIFP